MSAYADLFAFLTENYDFDLSPEIASQEALFMLNLYRSMNIKKISQNLTLYRPLANFFNCFAKFYILTYDIKIIRMFREIFSAILVVEARSITSGGRIREMEKKRRREA